MKWITLLIAVVVAIAAAAIAVAVAIDDDTRTETAAMHRQGSGEEVLVADGARLERRADGLTVTVAIPTPEPGSYEYPSSDMIAEWAAPHPTVSPGSSEDPEVFTLWVVVFNHPKQCTDGACDADDMGGFYQADGRIASGSELAMSGVVRLGETPLNGQTLENPLGAEVHLAIAPHGKSLEGGDLWRQLNGPVGNPSLFWGTKFIPAP